jgi:hypothetical protein
MVLETWSVPAQVLQKDVGTFFIPVGLDTPQNVERPGIYV